MTYRLLSPNPNVTRKYRFSDAFAGSPLRGEVEADEVRFLDPGKVRAVVAENRRVIVPVRR